ncbi:PadR family transcriptional regulator [Xanthomonas sp. XNM01]|uniref:PadR family transcriptional regulator n=1 Tax=Xanthomonas sp. XNM01 TaxID=2769289 RepID=UPI00178433A2|nr:PadR family transcriptional regulator [Xanthomonas sp. XNM01]MBD9370969.1 helix-turn-helix transcriptional regulator [Xanthomonas sp. XNM01]
MQPLPRRARGPSSERAGGGQRSPRAIAHGDLRLLVLALLCNQPRHGYELIQLIGEIFHGQYLPSAGAMYPVLSQLQEGGLVSGADDGVRRLYQLTDTGRGYVREHAGQIAEAQARTAASARALVKAGLPSPVRHGMASIKRAIAQRHGHWSPEVAQQVEQVLQRAAAEIAGIGR